MSSPVEVLAFWLDEVGPQGWYAQDDALDARIRDKFLTTWEEIQRGGHEDWLCDAKGSLAYVIVADQFSRNLFRKSGQAFSTDCKGLAQAKRAISKDWDLKIAEPARQFFYLPLMHSENLPDQERCVRLIKERMPQTGSSQLLHARAHRESIRQFGRFPYRNQVLGRRDTSVEADYVAAGGYRVTLEQFQTAVAAQ
jgi:uncharacterized protein (DUF924 family)